jgi:hypothetical protein
MAKANVTIIEAPMGEGKTLTVTGILVDDYFAHIKGIVSPNTGIIYPVQPVKGEIVKIFPPNGMPQIEEPKIISIPPNWGTISDTKIFCNYHLYGLRYVFCDPATMLKYLNEGSGETMKHCKMVIDEAYIQGEARRGMNSLSVLYTWFAQQMRKRDIELFLLVQHGRFIDWRFRYIAKRKILCRYNEKTQMIRLLVQNLGKGTEKPFSFWGPQYWKYYDTNELPQVPEEMVQRAGKWA